jgi:hypothetical protein
MMNSFLSASTVLRKLPCTLPLNSFTEYTVGLSNQLSHLRVWTHGLDEKNLGGIQVHAIWLVQFLASFYEHVVDLLGFPWLGLFCRYDHGIMTIAVQETSG